MAKNEKIGIPCNKKAVFILIGDTSTKYELGFYNMKLLRSLPETTP
jgi:hypothetical protein